MNSRILRETPMELFHERVVELSRKRRIPLDSDTEYYIVFLLASIQGRRVEWDHALAVLFEEGFQGSGVEHALKLQTVGDSALMISGFWSDFMGRPQSLNGVDYYIGLGQKAYLLLDERNMLEGPFGALAKDFIKLSQLLSELSESFSLTSMQDILKLYERWQHTRDPRLARVLKERGIDVIASVNPRSIH